MLCNAIDSQFKDMKAIFHADDDIFFIMAGVYNTYFITYFKF